MSRLEFHATPPAMTFCARLRRLHQDTFLKMEHHVRAGCNQGVVRDHQDGLAVLAHQFLDERHDFIGALAVEVAGGLVAEEKSGIGDDGAGDGHTLLLPAGKLAGKMACAVSEPHDGERGFHVLAARGSREPREKERELNILVRSENRDEVVHLKDEANVAGAPFGELAGRHVGDLIARHGNGAGGGDVEAAEEIEQGGFSGAARPHESHEVALIHVQIEALQDLNLLATPPVGLVEAADLDQGRGIPVGIDAHHVSLLLLLADFDSLAVLQVLRTAHDEFVTGVRAGHDFDIARDPVAEADGATLQLAIAHRKHIGVAHPRHARRSSG